MAKESGKPSLALDATGAVLTAFVSLLPWKIALGVGRTLGRLVGSLVPRKNRRVEKNLLRANAGSSGASCMTVWTHMSQTLFEMLWSATRSPEQVQRRMHVEGLDAFARASNRARGVLLVSAHAGNWEMVSHASTLAGLPVAVVARPLSAPWVERRLVRFRSLCGIRTLMRGESGASVAAVRWLRRGGILGCMIDRASSGRRVALPFLGASTNVPLGPFELAHRTGSAVVMGVARRQADGTTAVSFREVTDGPCPDPLEGARASIEALEESIRPHPEQWFWIYRRQTKVE
jgi:KDO2-lipid IV(A) lauroyltransferase